MGNIVENNIDNELGKSSTSLSSPKLFPNIFLKSILFFVILSASYLISLNLLPIIGRFLTSIGNFIFQNIIVLDDFKLFSEDNLLTIFYRFDNPIIHKNEYTYVSNEFDAHFIFPVSLFIALSCTEFIQVINKLKLQFTKNIISIITKIFIGGVIYLLFYYFKLFLLSYQNSLKIVQFDKFGKILEILDSQTFIFKFYTLLNNIFNIYGGITFRLLIILFIWALLFRREEIKNLIK